MACRFACGIVGIFRKEVGGVLCLALEPWREISVEMESGSMDNVRNKRKKSKHLISVSISLYSIITANPGIQRQPTI